MCWPPLNGLPEPHDGERQSSGKQQRQSLGEVVISTVLSVEYSKRLGYVEIEEPDGRKGPDLVVKPI